MSDKEDNGLDTWIKADGETKINLNRAPATIAKAKELGWTRKRGPKGKAAE